MKTLRKLLTNPFAVAYAVLHWVILLVALWNSNMHYGNWQVFLAAIIVASDLPAIIPAAILWSPFYLFAEDKTVFWLGTIFTSLFTITFQCLFIGKLIYNTFSPTESKLTSLSLTDE